MAVMVERQQRYCPDCNELLSFTSADVKKQEKEKLTIRHENGSAFSMYKTDVSWYITCPTCKNFFNVANFTRYKRV